MTSSSSPNESEKRLVVEGADGQPTRYYLGGGKITAEGVAWLYERLTGKKMSPEGLEEGRKMLAAARAELDRKRAKSDSRRNEGSQPPSDEAWCHKDRHRSHGS